MKSSLKTLATKALPDFHVESEQNATSRTFKWWKVNKKFQMSVFLIRNDICSTGKNIPFFRWWCMTNPGSLSNRSSTNSLSRPMLWESNRGTRKKNGSNYMISVRFPSEKPAAQAASSLFHHDRVYLTPYFPPGSSHTQAPAIPIITCIYSFDILC